jgi:omega-hydroxy-beta-dihydromenaquinone-9 sulfotransferase
MRAPLSTREGSGTQGKKFAGRGRLRLSLDAWRRLRGRINGNSIPPDWHACLGYWWRGACYSLLSRVQHASQADKIRATVSLPPLFILGFWRSGTTFLHEMFCCDGRFGFASTYACLNPFHFMLTEQWVRARPKQPVLRPMDSMHYSWASPQEDEFALFSFGAPSAYEALIFPSLMRDARSLLDLRQRSPEEQNRWVDVLHYFVGLLTVQQGKTMVLKSPTHGFRMPLLTELFPLARYVIIQRNPYEVFASNVRLWRTLLEMYSLESISPGEIESFILAAYVLHEQAIADGVRQVDPRRVAVVQYEELISDPIRWMARLYDELDLEDFEVVRPPLDRYLARVAGHTRNRLRLSLQQKTRIDEAWGTFIRDKGYTWSGGHITVG